MRRAYSYIRFSEPRQQWGDSLRRQAKLTEEYCERKKLSLDTSLALRDMGVSAYRGDNAATGALAAFLDAVRTGRVPKGSVLIVENLDRLTRNETLDAFELFASILRAGVTIATLSPEREYTREAANANVGIIMEAVLSLFLGHEESRKKSERVVEEWRARLARADKEKATARVPAWLRLRPDRTAFELIPDAAAAVRRIFRMAADGDGIWVIVRTLNAEGVPAIGRGKEWHRSYVRKVLTGRAAIGEYQSYTGRGAGKVPFGPPRPGYFPAVVTEAEFYAAQKAMRARRRTAGPRGERVTNLFTGLLKDARDKAPLNLTAKASGNRSLVSAAAARGRPGSVYLSFPYQFVEDAILTFLSEVRPADVLPPSGPDDTRERLSQLTARLAALEHKIAATQERIDRDPDIGTYLDLLARLERQKRDAAAEIDRVKQEATGGVAEAAGEVQSLVQTLRTVEPADLNRVRSRLRAKIAEVVDEVWCYFTSAPLVGSRGRICTGRVACLQVHFTGGARRTIMVSGLRKVTRVNAVPAAADLRRGSQWFERLLADVLRNPPGQSPGRSDRATV